jgi:hypothetical protein
VPQADIRPITRSANFGNGEAQSRSEFEARGRANYLHPSVATNSNKGAREHFHGN